MKTHATQYEICTAIDAVCFPDQSGSGAGQFNLSGSTGGIATDGANIYVRHAELSNPKI